jgi:hypothetical protein
MICPRCGETILWEPAQCRECGWNYRTATPVVYGLDPGTFESFSVFRCECGFEANEAKEILAHRREAHR